MRNISESRLRLKQLKSWCDRFENTSDYSQWKMFSGMSLEERGNLWKEWNEFYQKVRETKIGRLLTKTGEAFNAGDFGKVKEIYKWLKENEHTILSDAPHRPVLSDPYEIQYRVSHYLPKKSELESLQSFFQDLGEESKDKNSLL